MKEFTEYIYSPCIGNVEKIFVDQNSYVYEWEKLMLIRTSDDETLEIKTGVSGRIVSVEVTENQLVTSDTILMKLKDHFLFTGSE
ncbi:hypothetical protein CN689_24245 [Peribacillus butanolivorans]|uniref:Biotin carboxyl carrier protein n=1 Tax=Peribacillus butanolivorans TaxID=421767 RepID=A0AAX0RWU9_9BACI|nr:biotin/lipoyl-binding protein [Peribacillus butanolivorans]MCO0600499.1 biotin/lipoyl-binding protein [Peribacillus butanolivorans]PEJ27225.1 hypothetical protein CN689_24245 [Peribacillus butanolivorans]